MAIDIIARGLASSLLGEDGKISSEKLPALTPPDGAQFHAVGALTDPSQIEGRTAEEVLLMMLFGIVNPTLIDPSISIELNNVSNFVIGREYALQGTVTFDRGKIAPAYGTSGFRAGLPTSFTVAGNNFTTTETICNFEIIFKPTERENILHYSVNYQQGEQPVNSLGGAFGSPLAAGTLTGSISLDAVYAIYDATGAEISATWFEDESGAGYLATFASESSGVRQSFAISNDLTVVGVKGFDTMIQQWVWLGSEDAEYSLAFFDTTDITGESLGETTHYTLYTYNHMLVGERELRIYVE